MTLSRKGERIVGVYRALEYKHKAARTIGLKRRSYFLTLEACLTLQNMLDNSPRAKPVKDFLSAACKKSGETKKSLSGNPTRQEPRQQETMITNHTHTPVRHEVHYVNCGYDYDYTPHQVYTYPPWNFYPVYPPPLPLAYGSSQHCKCPSCWYNTSQIQ
eukprot:TRINITY_DN52001_c0_g1_i3.p1 TRINITY_DN52001_c0_g1~~TRINITY_DN52001_c0_g1_i3.p1  ORF type:complete len:159 (-),score=16.95 TRINITY_DN52001_c0_g1_i3:309-785(-)